MTTTVRGAGRKRYAAGLERHSQGAPAPEEALPAAPMAPPSTPWGRVAQAAEEAGHVVVCSRSVDGRRVVATQRGRSTLTVVWDAAQNVLEQSWSATGPDYTKRPIRSEEEALAALQG